MAEGPRVAAARNRAASAKRALAALSVVGFLGAFVLVRAAHPGAAAPPATSNEDSSSQSQNDDESRGFGFGGGSISPPQRAVPDVQTSTS